MKIKLTQLVVSFLLLFPFRLPISILLIQIFNDIALLGSHDIPKDVLCGNVIITKFIYNAFFSGWLLVMIEKISREKKGRRAINLERNETVYWWTILTALILLSFAIYDSYCTYLIFYK